MVKLYCLSVLYKSPTGTTWLKSAFDLQGISFFQRGSAHEFMQFCCKTVVEHTVAASRQSVKQGEYFCHVYVRSDNLAGVVISDHEYPQRVSHTLLTKILDEFADKIPPSSWPNLQEKDVAFPALNSYLAKYQNPREADALTKIQSELDETKIILHSNIQAVLNRGEKLDDLVAKSEELSMQSKAFYTTARKTNSCCSFS